MTLVALTDGRAPHRSIEVSNRSISLAFDMQNADQDSWYKTRKVITHIPANLGQVSPFSGGCSSFSDLSFFYVNGEKLPKENKKMKIKSPIICQPPKSFKELAENHGEPASFFPLK